MKRPRRYIVRCPYCWHEQEYKTVCEACGRYIYNDMIVVDECPFDEADFTDSA